MPSLPDRWMNYKPYGTAIEGTKIVAFKVPLKVTMVKSLLPEQQFTTSLLMTAFPKLKFVIDLTNTSRYYSKEEFTDAGVGYHKILVEGKKVPKMDCIKQFFKAMDDFYATAKDDELIGVHCTHGLNRTGYLVCRYLVQQLGWNLDNAIEGFKKARGHPIERQEYIEALKLVPQNQKLDTSNVKLMTNIPNNKKQIGNYNHKNNRQFNYDEKITRLPSRNNYYKNNNNYNNEYDYHNRTRDPYPIAPHPSQLPMPCFSLQNNQHRYGRMPENNYNSRYDEIPYVNGSNLQNDETYLSHDGSYFPPRPPTFTDSKYSHRSVPYSSPIHNISSTRRPNFYPPRINKQNESLLVNNYQPNYHRSSRYNNEHSGYRSRSHAEPPIPMDPIIPMSSQIPITPSMSMPPQVPMIPPIPMTSSVPLSVNLPYQRTNFDNDRVNDNYYNNSRKRELIPKSSRQKKRRY